MLGNSRNYLPSTIATPSCKEPVTEVKCEILSDNYTMVTSTSVRYFFINSLPQSRYLPLPQLRVCYHVEQLLQELH